MVGPPRDALDGCVIRFGRLDPYVLYDRVRGGTARVSSDLLSLFIVLLPGGRLFYCYFVDWYGLCGVGPLQRVCDYVVR